MTATISWVGLRLDPLDTLFFRDGRPFDAATRVSGGLPFPQTLAGAVRTALLARTGFRFDEFAKRRKGADVLAALKHKDCGADPAVVAASFRGPWLALADDDGRVEPLLPMPVVLARSKDSKQGWSRARPLETSSLPGWSDPDKLLPLWRIDEPDLKAESGWLTLKGLTAFLDGGEPEPDQCVKPAELLGFDNRVGIEVDKHTFTSAEGMFYAIHLLALKPRHAGREVCLYAEVQLDDQLGKKLDDIPVPFGGEGKYVCVRKVDEPCRWRTEPTSGRALWYLATPTFFRPAGRPLPPLPSLRAAASAAGVPVSGWDVALNGPRPTRFAVPAGAVYFVDGPCGPTTFLDVGKPEDSAALWQEGWGFALPGKWEGKL